jgi:Gpi18-like mannosyltransferase
LWTGKRFDYLIILLGSLLNIAFSYNTVMWGQVDAIFAAFVIAGFFYLDKGQYRLSAVMIVLALNMKLQAIIFIPMWGLMMLAFLQRDRRWKEALVIIPLMFLVQGLLLLPFFFGEGGLQPVWNAVTGLADTYPFISMNAFNMWYWFVPGLKFYDQKDEALFLLNLSYQQAGLILFCLASLAALWPILLYTIRVFIRRNSAGLSREVIWLSAALITLVFFFFNTRMHERYVHAAFIFLTTYAFYHRRFGLYVLFSVAYFLNLERILHWFALKNYETLVFDPRFVAALFAGCIIWAFVLLYQAAKGDPEGGGPLRLRGRP